MKTKKKYFYYCPTCLSTNLRPNGYFELGKRCFPCQSEQKHSFVNYLARVNSLKLYLNELDNNSKKIEKNPKYNCIVGVSGGKDSTRQALWVRDRLGMKPLLVCISYPPIQSTELGKENLKNLINQGFDIVTYNPAPETSRQLTKRGFINFGNVSKATEMVLHSIVPKIAIEENIKIIFWGDNPATQTGDKATLGSNIFDGNNLSKMNTLTEGSKKWIKEIGRYPSIYEDYFYPKKNEIDEHKINTIYLGPALDKWTMLDNSIFSILHGLNYNKKSSKITGDYLQTSMLDEEYTNINMMIKYFKFGFGRATDTVNTLIRENELSREDAIKIVNDYDGVCSDKIINQFCNYIDISQKEFWNIVNSFTNKKIFSTRKNKRPIKKFKVGESLEH